MVPSEEQRAALVAHLQHALALVRGPFLDGFWLGEDAPFDEWVQQQQQQWQVRLYLLLGRLSSWQEGGGGVGQAPATPTGWPGPEPLGGGAPPPPLAVPPGAGGPAPPCDGC